jgi:lauroyl/myristoyl acyltransferase
MAAKAAKNQRVTDLFTEGRHHRNLSVISKLQRAMRHFDDAINRPYGYLLLVLKPTKPEALHMRMIFFFCSERGTSITSNARKTHGAVKSTAHACPH